MQHDTTAEQAFEKIKAGETEYHYIEILKVGLEKGFRLDAVEELLASSNAGTSSVGVFILEELNYRTPVIRENVYSLREAALRLDKSPDGWRRKAFVEFCINARLDDEEVLKRISDRLDDTDLFVRCLAMGWVRLTRNASLIRMARLLFDPEINSIKQIYHRLTSINPMDRRQRAFKIAVMAKAGMNIAEVLKSVGLEDSFTRETLLKIGLFDSDRPSTLPPWQVNDR